MESRSLTILSDATRMLSEARKPEDAKDIMDMAAAAKIYAKKHGLGKEAVGYAQEIEIEAEIRLGEILKDMDKNKGTKGQLIGKDISGDTLFPASKSPGETKRTPFLPSPSKPRWHRKWLGSSTRPWPGCPTIKSSSTSKQSSPKSPAV